jgi:hypothetical protein
MKISQIISEVLDITGPAPETKWHTSKDSGSTVAKWTDDTGKEIQTVIKPLHYSSPQAKDGVSVEFNRNKNFDISGDSSGATSKILTGVVRNLKHYLDTRPDINSLYFTSVEPSRTKAYLRMIDRLAPTMGLIGTRIEDGPDGTRFALTRAQPGQQHAPLVQKQAGALATPTVKAPVAPTVAPPAAATKLPLPPGRAIPNPLLKSYQALPPSIAGSHGDSLYKFQGELDRIKRTMPRI